MKNLNLLTLATLTLLLLTLIVISAGRYGDFVRHHELMADNSTRLSSARIALYLREKRHLAELVAHYHAPLIEQAVATADPQDAMAVLKQHFPALANFNLADAQGRLLIPDPLKLVGKSCRHDILHFLKNDRPRDIFVHRNPKGRHIDIVTRFPSHGSNARVLFISLDAEEIRSLLDYSVAPGHYLLMFRSDHPKRVELSARNGDAPPTGNSDATLRLAETRIPGTRWTLADMVPRDLFSGHAWSLFRDASIVFLAFLVTIRLLTRRIHAEFVRRQATEDQLARLNASLEQQVSDRTRELNYLANHDPLTDLPNRRFFEARLADFLDEAHQGKRKGVLLFLDLDRFKLVNDTAGHVAGDELLRQLADLMREVVDGGALLARLGGDEFGLIIRDIEPEEAHALAARLMQAIRSFRFQWENRQYEIGASIGGLLIDEHAGDIISVLRQADMACYANKESGSNEPLITTPGDEELDRHRMLMERRHQITDAVREDRLELHLQPIVGLKDEDRMWRFECLLRLKDRNGKLIPPSEFIPAAEQYGGMQGLDLWVLQTALELMAERDDLCLNVNFSGITLSDANALKNAVQMLRSHPAPAGRLCIEITETSVVSNLTAALTFMRETRLLGVRFALDDFGSGISSLGYLKRLPVDLVKIDGSLIRELDTEERDCLVVAAIHSMCRALGKDTVAEFVERRSLEQKIREIGMEYAQGFLYGKPAPVLETLEALPIAGTRT